MIQRQICERSGVSGWRWAQGVVAYRCEVVERLERRHLLALKEDLDERHASRFDADGRELRDDQLVLLS